MLLHPRKEPKELMPERLEHILSYRSDYQKVYVAALTIYLDDSGTHPEAPYAVVAGWISPFQQWKKLTREWKHVAKEEGFTVFHMSECMANNRKSEFADWDEDKKRRVIHKLRGIIEQRVVQGFAITLNKKDYDDVMTPEVRKKAGDFHYTFAVRTILGVIETWRDQHGNKQPTEYIFDRMSQGRKEIDGVFADAESQDDSLHRYGIYKGCHSFRDKAEIVPLQAADIIAWLSFQRAHFQYSGKPVHAITSETFDALNNRNFKAMSFTRDSLREWVQKAQQVPDPSATALAGLSVKVPAKPNAK